MKKNKTPQSSQRNFPNDVLENMGDMPNYNGWVVENFLPSLIGRAAEIGAGLGTISGLLYSHVDSLELVEPSPALANALSDKFREERKCRVVNQSLETWIEETSRDDFDSIVMVNVLEHIEDDLTAAKGLHAALKPSGRLMIFVPALPFLFSELDRKYGHFRRYTRKSLADTVTGAGFTIETLRYFDIAGVFPWWLINKVMGKTSFHQPSLTIYDRLVVPPTRFLESIIPPPFGKNLILIARKD